MKKIIIFYCLLMTSGITNANIDSYYAVINDPDGNTNIREEYNLKSPIITKLNNGTPISVRCDEGLKNKNFCEARFGKTEDVVVSKNRLTFLTPNATFNKIPLTSISANKTEGTFSNKNVLVNVKFNPIKIDIKKTKEVNTNKFGGCEVLYNNKCAFGYFNRDTKPDYTQLQTVLVKVNGKTIVLPPSATQDIYLSRYFLANDAIANDIGVYQNKKDNHLYIIGRFADGALLYSVIYEIKDGKYFRKSVWSEAI